MSMLILIGGVTVAMLMAYGVYYLSTNLVWKKTENDNETKNGDE